MIKNFKRSTIHIVILILFGSIFCKVSASSIEEGYYRISSAVNENKVIDISQCSNENGANVQLWEKNDSVAQVFKIMKTSNNYYEIIAMCSGKALDIEYGVGKSGTNVWQYDRNGTNAQKWKFQVVDKAKKYFYIKSRLNNLNLDVFQEGNFDGANIQVWSPNRTNAQKYKLEKVDIEKLATSYDARNGHRINWVKDYLYNRYMSKNIRNIMVLGDKTFCDNFKNTFKNQKKFKFDVASSISEIKNFSKYDFVLNGKYKGQYVFALFKNANIDNFEDIYPYALCQTTIDYLTKNKIPIYFFNAPSRYKIKNMNEFEKSICNGNHPGDFSMHRNPDYLDKIYGNNEECKKYICSPEYKNCLKVRKIKNHYGLADSKGKYLNIIGGKRITLNAPTKNINSIYMFGPCTIMGQYVSDKYTIENFMQKRINKDFPNTYKVENCGLIGDIINDFEYILDTEFKYGDIVILEREFDERFKSIIRRNNCSYNELSNIFNRPHNIGHWMVNQCTHINHNGNRAIAKYIYSLIKKNLTKNLDKKSIYNKKSDDDKIQFHSEKDTQQDTFIKENPDFIPYLETLKAISKDKRDKGQKIGSLNMNCNPFTLGHRYLVEESAKKVDHLYLFVVEEDASEFSFKDRYEMVKRGVADIENVTVLKTGKWMCSKFTFPDYFDKDDIQDKIILNPTKDIDLYGKYIAPALGATIRFAGEEPFDLITRQHNDFMRNTLPKYKIEFCEIPRKTLEDGQVISASKVRKLLKNKEFEEMKKFLPNTTYEYLLEHF